MVMKSGMTTLAVLTTMSTVSLSGWTAKEFGWKIRDFPAEKKIARPGFKWLGKMEVNCSVPCLTQTLLRGYGKCQQ